MAVKDSNLVATNYENMGLGEDTPSALLLPPPRHNALPFTSAFHKRMSSYDTTFYVLNNTGVLYTENGFHHREILNDAAPRTFVFFVLSFFSVPGAPQILN